MAGIEGKSYSEIAIRIGLSVEAVRCRLARPRQGFREALSARDEATWIRDRSGQVKTQ
jgi:DNA-directed RNA polymerase specialized sigma24 family protein